MPLSSVWADIWRDLGRATVDRRSPWRSVVLCTLDGHCPQARTVVLRQVQPRRRRVLLHTDARAQKVGQLQRAPQVALLWWDPRRHQQLRAQGRLVPHSAPDEAARAQAWAQLGPRGQSIYRPALPPGIALGAPQQVGSLPPAKGQADAAMHLDADARAQRGAAPPVPPARAAQAPPPAAGPADAACAGDDAGFANFRLLVIEIVALHWLHLAHTGHHAATFVAADLADLTGPWRGQWRQP